MTIGADVAVDWTEAASKAVVGAGVAIFLYVIVLGWRLTKFIFHKVFAVALRSPPPPHAKRVPDVAKSVRASKGNASTNARESAASMEREQAAARERATVAREQEREAAAAKEAKAARERQATRESEEEAARRARERSKESHQRPWWEVLGVLPNANIEDIKRTYREKIHMYHPDRVHGLAPEFVVLAETRSKELNAAFTDAKRART